MIGRTISHYRIVEKLGEGGMGVVYKAEDTKLERIVALKFLAAHLLNDQEAKQRFLREAKSTAALHHPNICTVFEVAEEDGRTFLAMAYLEGESLEERIAKGPLPLTEALEIGRQIAEGLEAAHEKGVVHRDIKPANVMVDAKGRATILDFGLARLTEASKLTRQDQTVGTMAYMSPEQIQGGEVGPRTDVWALGCTLYEMVAGARPFLGQYDQALAYEILNEQPEPLTAVRSGVPMELEFIVGKCLAKDTADRYHQAGDIVVDLRRLAKDLESGRSRVHSVSVPTGREPVSSGSFRGWGRLGATAAGMLALGLLLGSFLPRGAESPPPIYEFDAPLPENHQLLSMAFSPDGGTLVAALTGPRGMSLWRRPMDGSVFTSIPGTDDGTYPFWSPDSAWIGFFAHGSLKKVPADGGAAVTLCAAPSGRGGTWNRDGVIVFSPGPFADDLQRVSDQGGRPERVGLRLTGNLLDGPRFPTFLPDGERFLYANQIEGNSGIFVASLRDPQPVNVLPDISNTAYLELDGTSDGKIVFERDGALLAQRVDNTDLRPIGAPAPVRESVARTAHFGYRGFATSASGSLACLTEAPFSQAQLAWHDRDGREVEKLGEPAPMQAIDLSPDGRRVSLLNREEAGVYTFEFSRGILTRVETTFGARRGKTAWLSSRSLAISVMRTGGRTAVARALLGSNAETDILIEEDERGRNPYPLDASADGRYLLFLTQAHAGDNDIWALPLDGGEPVPVAATPSGERFAEFSPDGSWVAFSSDQSGRREIYVQDFPAGEKRIQVTDDGGDFPRWRSEGRELFYIALDGTLMVVPLELGDEITARRPERLFHTASSPLMYGAWPTYDVSADGRSILIATPVQALRQSIRVRTSIMSPGDQ